MLKTTIASYKKSQKELFAELLKLREQKGKEKELLDWLEKIKTDEHEVIMTLLWEEALTWQHLYMNDDSNKKALLCMKKTVEFAQGYIEKFDLDNQKSRLYRFWGVVNRYYGNFDLSLKNFKEALKYIGKDNEPFRFLELESFISRDLILTGNSKLGWEKTLELIEKYQNSAKGRELKKESYMTWAIWFSGLLIKNVEAFIDTKADVKKSDLEKFLKIAEEILDKGDFAYRRKELADVRLKLH